MRKYKVGLVAQENEVNNRLKIKGKYFIVEFSKVNSDSHFASGYELIICTNNIRNARKVMQLIAASLALLNRSTFFTLGSLPKITPLQVDKEEIPWTFMRESISSFSDIPIAAKISANASYKRKYYLALLNIKWVVNCTQIT
jgi:hypothetical protein